MSQPAPTPADRPYGNGRMWITWMTCGSDGYEHAVTDEAIIAGKRHHSGVYGAMCGHAVIAQALVAPPGRLLPDHGGMTAAHAHELPPESGKEVRVAYLEAVIEDLSKL